VARSLVIALMAGVFEELGWTGFAVPALRRRHGPFATGLIVGVLWGLWHFLPKIWGAAANGVADYLAIDLAAAVVGLTGFRILMVWVYDWTGGSLPVGVVMHVGLTASTLLLQPALSGAPLIRVLVVLALVPWMLVGVGFLGGGVPRKAAGRVAPAPPRPVAT
jgi:membrane protease YdiL (CAAX protease family)